MDYIGLNFDLGLSCSDCRGVTITRYSEFLSALTSSKTIRCSHCNRDTRHDWRSLRHAERLHDDYQAGRRTQAPAPRRMTRASVISLRG